MFHFVKGWLDTGIVHSKGVWRSLVKKSLDDVVHCNWRFELFLSHKLFFYRIVHTVAQPLIWWRIAQKLPSIKKPCSIMLRLLCGSNILAVNIKTDITRRLRICSLCTCNQVEDLLHFVMYCPRFTDMRLSLMSEIDLNLSPEGKFVWHSLSVYMQFLLLIGLDFPLDPADLYCVRYFGCIYIHNMYMRRRSFEPP